MQQRAIAVLISASIVLTTPGCYVRKQMNVPGGTTVLPAKARIIGVTTKDARYMSFDQPGRIVNGAVQARFDKKDIRIPVDQVQHYLIDSRRLSAGRTVALAAALALTGVVIWKVSEAAADLQGGSWGGAGVKCCLFIYSWDGRQYSFDAETFAGAITRGLERDDYSELPHLKAHDGEYRLLLSNDLDETQYTNLLELKVGDHRPGLRLRPSADGTLHDVSRAIPPSVAIDEMGRDLLPWLQDHDERIWESEPIVRTNGDVRHDVVLTFPKPEGAEEARLVSGARTSMWGSMMAAEFLKLHGRDLPQFYRRIDEDLQERAELLEWMSREDTYTLRVYVEEPTGWELRGVLPTHGPFVAGQTVTALDVSRVLGNQLRIRLRPPAGFWAFNSFAVAYGPEAPFQVTTVPLSSLPELAAVDDRYLVMERQGQQKLVAFPVPRQSPGTERTIFLHTRGYYRMHLDESGEPQPELFEQLLKQPDAAARMASQKYRDRLPNTTSVR